MKLDDFLCFTVYSTNHAFNRIYKPLLETLDLTYPQYLAMVALWQKDDQTVGSLGEKLFLESSTLTPLLKRLEATGHLKRVRDARDERQVRIQLTESGRALEEKAQAIPNCILEATGLTEETLQALKHALSKVRTAMLR
ncbi:MULTISPECIES: MarR family winged helix-turn-helix transcriptional regulator [Rhizobium/Agrobacterium group]|uniref:MarR family transcriptional regulator n=1 Tax=Pararhizobium antarcticum TaxID=1798805 RepID=A0A657LTY5_9HYPH|nr:MarR family transcriptional regulator [Rhizobium sp. 58]OJF98298.1 MarR family transcriptional regulator [Pararhizobium antarcticum]